MRIYNHVEMLDRKNAKLLSHSILYVNAYLIAGIYSNTFKQVYARVWTAGAEYLSGTELSKRNPNGHFALLLQVL